MRSFIICFREEGWEGKESKWPSCFCHLLRTSSVYDISHAKMPHLGGKVLWIPLLCSRIHDWLIFPFSPAGMAVWHPENPSSLTLLAHLPHVPHSPFRSQLGFLNHKLDHKVLHPYYANSLASIASSALYCFLSHTWLYCGHFQISSIFSRKI